jgi:protocatechuate 3,4-dioxygenase, beta subunit
MIFNVPANKELKLTKPSIMELRRLSVGRTWGDAMRAVRVVWAVGMSLAFGSSSSSSLAQELFPTMASVQGRMPCGSCRAPSTISSQATIVPLSEAGERLVISGIVYEPDGVTPAPAITIFVYHTDARGHYNSPDDALNPRLYGWVRTGTDGRYEFWTIRPGPYPQVTTPAHIHVHVFGPGRPEWFIPEYLFEGDPLIPAKDRDLPARLGRFSPIVQLTKDSEGAWRGHRDIRLEKPASR